jgi:hypothetical protein
MLHEGPTHVECKKVMGGGGGVAFLSSHEPHTNHTRRTRMVTKAPRTPGPAHTNNMEQTCARSIQHAEGTRPHTEWRIVYTQMPHLDSSPEHCTHNKNNNYYYYYYYYYYNYLST